MLNANTMRPSMLPFMYHTMPFIMTRALKAGGTYRLCTGFGLINLQRELFPYPVPNMDKIINNTSGYNTFPYIGL